MKGIIKRKLGVSLLAGGIFMLVAGMGTLFTSLIINRVNYDKAQDIVQSMYTKPEFADAVREKTADLKYAFEAGVISENEYSKEVRKVREELAPDFMTPEQKAAYEKHMKLKNDAKTVGYAVAGVPAAGGVVAGIGIYTKWLGESDEKDEMFKNYFSVTAGGSKPDEEKTEESLVVEENKTETDNEQVKEIE